MFKPRLWINYFQSVLCVFELKKIFLIKKQALVGLSKVIVTQNIQSLKKNHATFSSVKDLK